MRFILWTLFAILVPVLALPVFAQDVQGDVYVEASISNANPYVGEQITYKFVLYDAVGLANPLYQPSDFEGFWRIDMGVISQTTAEINGRQYTVTTIATALYATQAGEVTIKPSSVVLPETVFRSKTTLTANPIVASVRSLPDGKPADFGGAVGQINVSGSLDRQSAKVGEPITMSLTITGTGNIEQLQPPLVPQNWRTTVNTGTYSNEIQNGLVVGRRDYQIVFFPKTSGKQELPPIALNYFDPASATYRSVSTSPIAVDVTGDAVNTTQQPQFLAEPSLRLKAVNEAHFSRAELPYATFVILFILPIFGVLAVFGWHRTQTERQRREIIRRRQQALQVAIQHFNKIAFSDIRSGYEEIDGLLQRYVADKLNIQFADSRKIDIQSVIVDANVPKPVVEKVTMLMSEIEEGLFAPSAQVMPQARRDEIRQSLIAIDHQWEKM